MKKQVKEIQEIIEIQRNGFENFEAFDADNNKMVSVNQKMYDTFWIEYDKIKDSTLRIAQSLYLIRSQSLFVAVKCKTFAEFCERIGFGARSAQQYARIGERLTPELGKKSEREFAYSDQLNSLGVKKLYELTKFTQEQLGTLFKGGDIFSDNGIKLSLDDVNNMSTRELAEHTAKMLSPEKELSKSAYKEEIAKKDEELKTLKEMYEDAEEKLTDVKKERDMFRARYGDKITGLKEKMEALSQVEELETQLFSLLRLIDIQEDDPQELLQKFIGVTKVIQMKVDSQAHFWRLIFEASLERI